MEIARVDVDFIKRFGIGAAMYETGYGNVKTTAMAWHTTPAAIRAMISRGQINDYVRIGNDIYISFNENKPTGERGRKRKENLNAACSADCV